MSYEGWLETEVERLQIENAKLGVAYAEIVELRDSNLRLQAEVERLRQALRDRDSEIVQEVMQEEAVDRLREAIERHEMDSKLDHRRADRELYGVLYGRLRGENAALEQRWYEWKNEAGKYRAMAHRLAAALETRDSDSAALAEWRDIREPERFQMAGMGRDDERPVEHKDERDVYYVTADGQRYHYEWCHDCGGEGCDYCDGVGQVRVDG